MLRLDSGYRYRSSGLRPNSSRHRLRFTLSEILHVAETLLIAAAGAIAFQMVGFPGGLVAGAMLAVAVAGLLGRPVKLPIALARVCFVLVGTLLGAVVTPQTLRGIADWPLSVALLVVSSLVMFAATASYLRWVHRWDGLSALLGASPGSMAQVMALAAELGADMRGVAIVRVLLSYLGAAFGSFAVAGTVAASFSLLVVALLPFHLADVMVAFAPGAQDTMMVLALALALDPVYVGAHHLVRFLVVSLACACRAARGAPAAHARA